WWLKGLLIDGANAWNISQSTMMLIFSVPFLVLMTGVIFGLFGKAAYKMFTSEDMIAETMQVILWVITFVLCISITKDRSKAGDKTIAALYGCLAIGLFFIIGEEVSWGQRVFGWSTPDVMKVVNKQEETNIHNIHGVGTTFKWLHLIVGAYGTFFPIILLLSKKLARYRSFLSMLVPHYTLIPFFGIAFVWRVYRNFFEAPDDYYFAVSEFTEVIEVILVFGFLFFMTFQFRRLQREKELARNSNNNHH
nr:hypothetical protein [candidate division KSB1 bacterium]